MLGSVSMWPNTNSRIVSTKWHRHVTHESISSGAPPHFFWGWFHYPT